MIRVFGDSPRQIDRLRRFRRAVFTGGRRDPAFVDAWESDRYDPACLHFVLESDDEQILACARVAVDAPWPLDERFPGLDKNGAVEVGRVGVDRRYTASRRTLFELMLPICHYCVGIGRPTLYGMMVQPFWQALRTGGIPLTVLSARIDAYGAAENVVRLEAPELVAFHRTVVDRPPDRSGSLVQQ